MLVTYHFAEERHTLETREEEDLRDLMTEIVQELCVRHPELRGGPRLTVAVADGLLDSLAEDCEEIALGELHAAQ
jgi:hypothetical protein